MPGRPGRPWHPAHHASHNLGQEHRITMPIPATLDGTDALSGLEVWFLTGSQELYGAETLRQVAEQSQAIAGTLAAADIPVRIVWRPVLTRPDDIRRAMLEATSDDNVRRRDRVDAHVLARPRCGSPACRCWASRCCTSTPSPTSRCPGPDRLRLHEPQPVGARRPGVRLHRDPARGTRARPSSGTCPTRGSPRRSRHGPGPPRLGGDPLAEAGPVRRQHAERRRHRGRQDRGRVRSSASRSTPGASTTSPRRSPTLPRRT